MIPTNEWPLSDEEIRGWFNKACSQISEGETIRELTRERLVRRRDEQVRTMPVESIALTGAKMERIVITGTRAQLKYELQAAIRAIESATEQHWMVMCEGNVRKEVVLRVKE